jgi:hypothetical protein
MPKYRIQVKVSFPGRTHNISEVVESKNEKEANREANNRVQSLKNQLGMDTISKPEIKVTLIG